jgi:hypothetical protein
MADEATEEQRLATQLKEARAQIKADRKLIQQAADVLGEIDRGPGLLDVHADVLAALRIRLEGKPRASLDELLSAAGDLKGSKKKGLEDLLAGGSSGKSDWPEIKEDKKDWPSL